ncbi:hypothetical protein GQ55_3G323900 [Panicum hallii var. hallii]|uniref:Uncharacterized protein n=1 Tax=Panicum hallii var. hallii TaxID=1504633 RepID=A0A2T7EFF2_9POAL|nr:hypothetical protein GQ55_3G323900 [Panicum hallii var. hallii]
MDEIGCSRSLDPVAAGSSRRAGAATVTPFLTLRTVPLRHCGRAVPAVLATPLLPRSRHRAMTRPTAPCAAERLVMIWVREAPHVVPTGLVLLGDRQPFQFPIF